MTQVSTSVFTHVIVFFDGGRKFITQEQYDFIIRTTAISKSISTPQLGYIAFASIAKIPEIEDFYQQFPDERPQYSRNDFEEKYPDYTHGNQQIRRPTALAREGMIIGLRQYCKNAGKSEEEAERIISGFTNPKTREGYWEKVVRKYQNKNDLTDGEKEFYEYALEKVKH